MTRLLARLRAFWRRREIRATVDEEIQFHVEMESAAHRARGLSPVEAARQAAVDLGGASHVREAVIDVRTPWVGRQVDRLRQDLVFAARAFRRAPLFTMGLLLTLALGIGANGAVFGILRAVLLQPLPYRQPDRLVTISTPRVHPPAGVSPEILRSIREGPPSGGIAWNIHQQLRDVLADTATYTSWQGDLDSQFDLTVGDHTERLRGTYATANFFDVLGVSAALGRAFTAADAESNSQLLVISDALWHRVFGGDPAVVGRTITVLAGRPRAMRAFTIAGVLPPAFRFTYPLETEAWGILPWAAVQEGRGRTGFWTIGRLAPGVPLALANARAATVPVNPTADERYHQVVALEPIAETTVGGARPPLVLLGAVAGVLLAIACATVGGALFIRMAERRRELALRAALGADRHRLVRQLLTEGALLATLGAALGTGLSAVLTPALRRLVPVTVPRANEISVDGWTLLFFAMAATVVTLLSTLAPAFGGARRDLVASLKRATTSSSPDRSAVRWRVGLVTFETALASALLVTASLLLVSFWQVIRVPLGFDGDRVLTIETRLLSSTYYPPTGTSPADPTGSLARAAFQDQLIAGIRALPGVVDAGLTSAVPFRGVDFTLSMDRPGGGPAVVGRQRFVDAGYFSVLRVPLLAGRMFGPGDTASAPRVVLVSQSYARQMFGADNPVGRTIDGDHPLSVIGVVGDTRYESATADAFPAIYFPRSQNPEGTICVVARTLPSAGNLAAAIARVIHRLDPDVPAMNPTTIDQIIDQTMADRRFYTTATTTFAALAILLTMAGLAVTISRAVVERRRELAIRSALGASRSAIAALVMRGATMPVIIGVVVGLAGVLACASLLDRFLFDVTPHAPFAYIGVAVGVVASAIVAALGPLRRALRMPAAAVLRAE